MTEMGEYIKWLEIAIAQTHGEEAIYGWGEETDKWRYVRTGLQMAVYKAREIYAKGHSGILAEYLKDINYD